MVCFIDIAIINKYREAGQQRGFRDEDLAKHRVNQNKRIVLTILIRKFITNFS